MFMTKFRSALAAVLVFGLTLGGVVAGIGSAANPVAVAQRPGAKADEAKRPDAKGKPKGDDMVSRERKGGSTPKSKEELAVQGVWTLANGESDGEVLSIEAGSVELVVTNEFWIWKERGQDRAFAYRIDVTQSPKHLDLKPLSSKGEVEETLSCIYEIEADALRVCESHKARPTEFSTKGRLGSGRDVGPAATLLVFKRKAK